jgi:hypothetical protein
MRPQSGFVVCLVVSVVWLGSGCGGDPLSRQAVSGTVSLNGTPVERGSINFHPVEQATTSAGAVIEAGKYQIPRDLGLPPGKYRVVINAPKPGTGGDVPSDGMPGEPVAVAEEMIPPEWNVNSDQFIEVQTGGSTEFNFDVKTAGGS